MTEKAKNMATTVSVLNNGGVIAYPTEAVWGLGCDPYCYDAVSKVLALKNRSVTKGLILVGSSIDQVEFLLGGISQSQRDKLEGSWPGHTSWLIEDSDDLVPTWIKGDFSSVAIRISDHPSIIAICNAFGGLLVSTSLNPSARPPALSEEASRAYFSHSIDCFVGGELGLNAKPSKIYNLADGKVIR